LELIHTVETRQGLFFLHLLKFPGRYQSHMMQRLTARGYSDLRLGFGPLVTVLARGSLRLTDLAAQLAMQKQNCLQLVRRIEQAGYLERLADPSDGRSSLLALNARGRDLVGDGIAVIRELDLELCAAIGEREFAEFSDAVQAIYTAVVPAAAGAGDEPVPGALINQLIQLANYTGAELNALVRARGYTAIRPVHEQVLLHLGEGRVRIADIARENDVSRQAISAIVNELRGLGYISLDVDPQDARGRIIRLTDAGNTLVQQSAEAAQGLLRRYVQLLGNARFERLSAALSTLYHHLDTTARPAGQAPSDALAVSHFVLAGLGGAGSPEAVAGYSPDPADARARVEQLLDPGELAEFERLIGRIRSRIEAQ
jgi:DNA-binding MarR family transcriptional regulator